MAIMGATFLVLFNATRKAARHNFHYDLGPAYVVLLTPFFVAWCFCWVLQEVCSNREAKLFKGSVNKLKKSCPHSCHYDDLSIQYGKDKQSHEDVLKRVFRKDTTDFIDPADTITLKDLDDDFTAAEVDSLISELSKWGFES